ncbi:MAG TPA: hypothetical protein VGA99_04615, partial [bacterium]
MKQTTLKKLNLFLFGEKKAARLLSILTSMVLIFFVGAEIPGARFCENRPLTSRSADGRPAERSFFLERKLFDIFDKRVGQTTIGFFGGDHNSQHDFLIEGPEETKNDFALIVAFNNQFLDV